MYAFIYVPTDTYKRGTEEGIRVWKLRGHKSPKKVLTKYGFASSCTHQSQLNIELHCLFFYLQGTETYR